LALGRGRAFRRSKVQVLAFSAFTKTQTILRPDSTERGGGRVFSGVSFAELPFRGLSSWAPRAGGVPAFFLSLWAFFFFTTCAPSLSFEKVSVRSSSRRWGLRFFRFVFCARRGKTLSLRAAIFTRLFALFSSASPLKVMHLSSETLLFFCTRKRLGPSQSRFLERSCVESRIAAFPR